MECIVNGIKITTWAFFEMKVDNSDKQPKVSFHHELFVTIGQEAQWYVIIITVPDSTFVIWYLEEAGERNSPISPLSDAWRIPHSETSVKKGIYFVGDWSSRSRLFYTRRWPVDWPRIYLDPDWPAPIYHVANVSKSQHER